MIGAGKFASFMQGQTVTMTTIQMKKYSSKNLYPIEVPEGAITEASAVASAPIKIVPNLAMIANADIDAGKKLSKNVQLVIVLMLVVLIR